MKLVNKYCNKIEKSLKTNKYQKLILDIIVDWKVPYFNIIQKYLIFLSILWLLIFIYPKLYKDFWEYSYNLLIFILIISPLSKIFPKFKIFNKILILRRQIWIIIWFFLIAHLTWFFITHNIWILEFIKNEIFNFKSFYFWWLWWTIFAIFPFITSNNISQKFLKWKWKFFQYWTYLFFIFSTFHIYTIKSEFEELWILFIWIILKILVYKRVVILK